MFHSKTRSSLAWTLFLLVLLTTQFRSGDAGTSLKVKKILKKILLLRALSPKKSISVLPIPIPLNLLKEILAKLLPKEMPKMEMMPPAMYPPYMPYEAMMMPKSYDAMMPKSDGAMMMMPKEEMKMPTKEEMMASSAYYD